MTLRLSFLMLASSLLTIPGQSAGAQNGVETQTTVAQNNAVQSGFPAIGGGSVQDLRIQLEAAKSKLARAKARYDAGQATSTEFEDLRTQVDRLELALASASAAAARQELIARLVRPVSVELKDATLTQAADSLSKAANIPIQVSKSLRPDARLNLDARQVPIASVLEAIAQNLNLKITPGAGDGVELRPWPEMLINGQQQVFADATRPWSLEWGPQPPVALTNALIRSGYAAQNSTSQSVGNTVQSGEQRTLNRNTDTTQYGSAGQRASNSIPANRTNNGVAQNSIAIPSGNSSAQGQVGYQLATTGLLQGVNMTSVGNAVVVAEAGRGPQGEPGAWLTVYMLDGVNLVKKSAAFHPTRATLVSPANVRQRTNGSR
jgi:hypothetical protein